MADTSRTIQKFQADAEAWKVHHAQRDSQIAQQECDTAQMISHSRDLLERTQTIKERRAPGQTSN